MRQRHICPSSSSCWALIKPVWLLCCLRVLVLYPIINSLLWQTQSRNGLCRCKACFFFCQHFGLTWYTALCFTQCWRVSFTLHFFFTLTPPCPVGSGMNSRTVCLTSVWLTGLMLCFPLDVPQTQPRMLHENTTSSAQGWKSVCPAKMSFVKQKLLWITLLWSVL